MKASVLSMVLVVAGCGDNGGGGGNDMAVSADLAASSHDMAIAATCDPFKQNCANATDKCQIELSMDASGMTTAMNVCIADGTVDEGQACTRSDPNSISDDNCKKGFACTSRGLTSPVCRKICKADTDCGSNQKCTGYSSNVTTGLCAPSCTFFGSECTGGLACNQIYGGPGQSMVVVPLCGPVGTKMLNDVCMVDANECAAHLFCLPDTQGSTTGACTPFCDDSHQCPGSGDDGGAVDGGLMCNNMAFGSLPNGEGLCL